VRRKKFLELKQEWGEITSRKETQKLIIFSKYTTDIIELQENIKITKSTDNKGC